MDVDGENAKKHMKEDVTILKEVLWAYSAIGYLYVASDSVERQYQF